MIDLTGRTVLVTGAGGGIGRAIARGVVRTGGAAILHDLRATPALSTLAAELGADRARIVTGDLADPAAIARLWAEAVAWRGRIDVLVNNAGIYEPADIAWDLARWAASWQRTLQVNLTAAAQLCKEAIGHFAERGGGIIVNMASRAAFRGDDPDYAHYAASKAGLVALTRTIARHHGRAGVTAFAVAPGFVDTTLNDAVVAQQGVPAILETIPLGAMAQPEDIANVVLFLASGLARHATGTTIDVNGASYVR